MDSEELEDVEENGEWRMAVLEGSVDIGAQEADLSSGGVMTLAGSAQALSVWAAAAAEAAGRQLVCLDLEGWEPEESGVEAFKRYQGRGAIEPSIAGSVDSEPVDAADSGIAAVGLFQAAFISAFASSEPELALDRRGFISRLLERSVEPMVILLADGDDAPMPLRRALMEAVEAAEGRIMLIDGTRGCRPAAARIVPKLSVVGDPRLEAITGDARRVLEALAILETPFPLEPLLQLLVAEASLHEQVIDVVDDLLVDELGWLEDLGFIHPVFENSLYRVADPLFAARLLADIEVPPRAEALLGHLRQRLPPRARATSCVLARLAELAGRDEQVRRLRLRLRWWVDADELKEDLQQVLAAEEISDRDLGTLSADGVLGAAIRLEILDTYQKAGFAPEAEGLMWRSQARALRDAGQALEALEAIERSLDWQMLNGGRQSEAFLETQVTAARILASLGEARPARDQLQQARQLAAEILEPNDPRHSVLAAELGQILIAVGELRAAKSPLEETVEWAISRFGENHPRTVTSRNNLAALLIDIGELEAARDHLILAIQGAQQAGLAIPLRVGLWSNLHTVTSRLGGREGTSDVLEQFTAQLQAESPAIGHLLQFANEAAENEPELGRLKFGHDTGKEFEQQEIRLLAEIFRSMEGPGGSSN